MTSLLGLIHANEGSAQIPGHKGDRASYRLEESSFIGSSQVRQLEILWGPSETNARWVRFKLIKASGASFRFWLLTTDYPSIHRPAAEQQIRRYVIEDIGQAPLEFSNRSGSRPVLPRTGFWRHLIPRASDPLESQSVFPNRIDLLGLTMRLETVGIDLDFHLPKPKKLQLPTHLQIGAKYTTRDQNEPRRYDGAEIKLIPYLPEDYPLRLGSGQTTFNVPSAHVELIRRHPVLYTGDDPQSMPYPDRLYQSNYLGPNPDYLDEPAVRTAFALERHLKAQPHLASELSIPMALDRFKETFHRSNHHGRPTWFQQGLFRREDCHLGKMNVLQENTWSWDVLLSTAAYQLRAQPTGTPSAIVYEGRIASRRDLARFNSDFGSQLPLDHPNAWLDIVIGLMRGAARLTGKDWGLAIYGQFHEAEIRHALTYAYEQGSAYFLFWTSDKRHHIPYQEQLEYSRLIRHHAEAHPQRDLDRLKRAATELILFPPGYTLISKEPMWWAEPLHYERSNRFGLRIRDILARVAAEIERCHRAGIRYDLAWDLEGLDHSGYQRIISVRENGEIAVQHPHHLKTFVQPWWPERPRGSPAGLEIQLPRDQGPTPFTLRAEAVVIEAQSPVSYSAQPNDQGIWIDSKIIWKLYGPGTLRFRDVSHHYDPQRSRLLLTLEEPGSYRLRASVVDLAGRATVRWLPLQVVE